MLESLQDVGFFSHHPLTQKVIALTRVAAIKKVAVHSCDFDGCFGPDFFLLKKKGQYQSLYDYNTSFVTAMREENQNNPSDTICFMVGSSRQDPMTDLNACMQMNARGSLASVTGSCFYEMQQFVEKIKAELQGSRTIVSLDLFLTADSYHNKKPGETFLECMSYGEAFLWAIEHDKKEVGPVRTENYHRVANDIKEKRLERLFTDKTKFSLLYAQMHKMALTHVDANMDFHFYDDRPDILNVLQYAYQNSPELIPSNLKLYLHCYAMDPSLRTGGSKQAMIAKIQGAGKVDHTYGDSIKWLRDLVAKRAPQTGDLFVIGSSAELLFNFLQIGDGIIEVVPTTDFHDFIAARQARLNPVCTSVACT